MDLIAAVSENGVIGKANSLPWHLPQDLRHFKFITKNRSIIMGSKTWYSLPRKLPDRTNIVISSDIFIVGPDYIYPNYEDAFNKIPDGIVIGGGQIYKRALKHEIENLYITKVYSKIDGDVYFPIDASLFGEDIFTYEGTMYYLATKSEMHKENGLEYQMLHYVKC